MLDTARVNVKTVWCLRKYLHISCTSSYDFCWNLAKALTLPHGKRRNLNGFASSVQLKIKMFLGTALLVDEPKRNVERRFAETGKWRGCQLHMTYCNTKREKDNVPKATEQCQSCGISIYQEHFMRVCHVFLQ